MKQHIQLQKESFTHITNLNDKETDYAFQTQSAPSVCKVFSIDASREIPQVPKNFRSIKESYKRLINSPKRESALEKARKNVISNLYNEDGDTLKTHRLRAGLSQTQIAEAIGTSQSHIARIERGTENITLETCRRIASILGIDMNTLDEAIRSQQNLLEKNKSNK